MRSLELMEHPLDSVRSLDSEFHSQIVALRDWLISEAPRLGDPSGILSGFVERLRGLGIPIDRAATAIEALHSEYASTGRLWTPEQGRSRAISRTISGARRSMRQVPSPM